MKPLQVSKIDVLNRVISPALIAASAFGAIGCQIPEADKKLIEYSLSAPGDVSPSPAPAVDVPTPANPQVACYDERHTQPGYTLYNAVDLLFVVDTSGSMSDNRAKVADAVDAFVNELPTGVSFHIAVMLAHGSESPWTGKLYDFSCDGTHNPVLDSQKMSMGVIRSHLRNNILRTPNDVNAPGEEGFYSFTQAMKPANLAAARAKGFFRPDAALATVFISDENDICMQMPKGTPGYPIQADEAIVAKRDCAGITPATVLKSIQDLQGDRPYIISSVIHHDMSKAAQYTVADGIGYGYLELTQMAKGVLIDIDDSSYNDGLSNVGKLTTSKLTLQTAFTLGNSNVDALTLKAAVDGSAAPFTYDATKNQISLTGSAGHAYSVVDVTYCQKAPAPSPVPPTTPTPTATPAPTGTVVPGSNGTITPAPTPTPTPTPSASPKPSPTGTIVPGSNVGT